MKRLIISSLLSVFVLTFSTFIFAQSISLYDQPAQNAKVIGTADLSAGIISIYSPPNSEWTKIADPRNGNVGWVKSSDLKTNSNVVFTQKIITNGQGNQSQGFMMKNGQFQPLDNQQLQDYLQKIRAEQKVIQDSFKNIWQQMNNLLDQQKNNLNSIAPATTQPASPPVKK